MKKYVNTRESQCGFTLVEAALMVLIMGLFLATIMASHNQSASPSKASEAIFMDTAVAALYKYVKLNNRLPCPDVNGDGLEDGVGGVCTADVHAGGIPYLTLGISLSSPVGTGLDRQFVYGVFRGDGGPEKDLTLSAERSIPPNIPTDGSYKNLDDFKQALVNAAAATSTVDGSNLYVTGNDADSGAADCSSNKVANVAFVVAFAGLRNANDTGTDFDGDNLRAAGWSNSARRWESVKTKTCFAGPGKPITDRYADQVRAVSFTELMGFLAR